MSKKAWTSSFLREIILYICKFFGIETIKFVLIKKIGNNVLMERAGYMKKTLTIACALFLASMPSYAENYQFVNNGVIYKTYNTAQNEQKDIFQNSSDNDFDIKTEVNESENNVAFVLDKAVKAKYKEITKSPKLIEAAELLKKGAGSFSYRSIHGSNPTGSPIKISFLNMSKDKEHQDADAYGKYEGKKYFIYINSKYEKSPAGAIAPLLAREALVNRSKSESDKEIAKQLQIAVWVQLCSKISGLDSQNDSLVRIQNMLKSGANTDDYSGFLKGDQPNIPVSNKEKHKKISKKPKGHAAQLDFDADYQAESEKVEVMTFDSKAYQKKYKKITSEDRIIEALELLKNTVGKFSYDAILQKNLTHKPMVIKFKNLSEISPQYGTFDALGWRQGGKLHIYINSKHSDAPAAALAALLSHEALHQDEFDSLNEETYAWTMEASVWIQLCDQQPNVEKINHPLVTRENMLKQLFEKGDYTSRYIKKSVFSNPGYSKLPVRSPGFEEDL